MFEFTPIKTARPTKYADFNVMRDWFCLYCDIETSLWYIWMSTGDRIDDANTERIIEWLKFIAYNKKKRTKKDSKIILYINDIDKLQVFGEIQTREDFTDLLGDVKSKKLKEIVLTDFIVRDAEPLTKETIKSLDEMIDIVSSYGLEPYRLKLTQASNAKLDFFRPISKECWQDVVKHDRYINRLQTYRDITAGSAAGFLKVEPETTYKILQDVSSFDISSAYPSKYVQLDIFPIGKIYKCRTDRFKRLSGLISSGEWFQIVFNDVKISELDILFKSKYFNSYGINCIEFAYAQRMPLIYKALTDALNKYDWTLYFSDDQGYLLDSVRYRIVEFYEKKSIASTKSERTQYKMKIDMLYGKSIERDFFTEDKDVKNNYFRKGYNYLLPHWARLVVASTKLQVFDAYVSDPYAFSADTDSVKSTNDLETLEHMFFERNKIILDKNEKAGFSGCKIGTWTHEYTADRFVQFCPKQYIYDINGEIHYKLAGFSKDDIETALSIGVDDPIKFFIDNPSMLVTQGIEYDCNTDSFSKVKKLVKLGDMNE